MIMTWKCASGLMDILACVCISANGGVPKEGLTEQQEEKIHTYAANKFQEILGEWEELKDEEWQIECPEKEDEGFQPSFSNSIFKILLQRPAHGRRGPYLASI